jgi:hypothetical protein
MNGLMNRATAGIRWLQAGGLPIHDAAYSTAIGGYPNGAILVRADGTGFWRSTADNNLTDPDTGGAGWRNLMPLSTPNAALNPDFDIAQRGTSFVSPVDAAYDLDGWVSGYVSSAVTAVIQGIGHTTGRYSRQVTVTTADTSIAAGDFLFDQLKLTGYDIVDYDLIGNTFTVSFWEKFPLTGIHCAVLKNSGNDRSYVHEFNVDAANTWAEYQFTVEGGLPTAGTWNYTTGVGLRLQVTHACGSTFQTASVNQWVTGNYMGTANQVNDLATIGNVWAISKLRINPGTQPTSHSVSRAEMLVRCQERCYDPLQGLASANLAIGPVTMDTTTDFFGTIPLPNMLYIPTLSVTATNFTIGYPDSQAVSALTLLAGSTKTLALLSGTCGALVAGDTHHLYRPGTTSQLLLIADI